MAKSLSSAGAVVYALSKTQENLDSLVSEVIISVCVVWSESVSVNMEHKFLQIGGSYKVRQVRTHPLPGKYIIFL